MTVSAICAIDEIPHLQTATDSYDYDAFGNLLNPASSGTPNNYLYRGEQWDADLGSTTSARATTTRSPEVRRS